MSCTDCLKNCDPINSDKCVQYTGPDIDALGVCTGDSLYEIEAIILAKLQTLADGSGISLSDVTLDCDFIKDILDGADPTVANLVQALATASCDLKTQIDSIDSQVNAPFSISADCLSLSATPTRDEVLQAVATKVCAVNTAVDDIAGDYVKASELCDLVAACSSGSTQEYTKMPKYVALPYHGPLSVFDSSGKGISAMGYDKVYMCIGQTVGTFTLPDYRGRSPIGANTNVPGGTMDSGVDPSLPANAGYSIIPGTKKGEYAHTMTNLESAAHVHGVTDSGHFHATFGNTDMDGGVLNSANAASRAAGLSGNATYNIRNSNQQATVGKTSSVTTGISISSSGGGQPHNTTHPVIGTTFIIYIP